MLSRPYRLTARTDFARVKTTGVRIDHPLFTLLVAPSESLRFGFVVSKAISKRAVDRNHIRRLLSEAISHKLPLIKGKADVVILTKRSILSFSLVAIDAALDDALTRAHLI